MNILILNAGSSTLKFALFDQDSLDEPMRGAVDWRGSGGIAELQWHSPSSSESHRRARVANLGEATDWILHTLTEQALADSIVMLGYRVVHGGTQFRQPTLITEEVDQALRQVSELAPLHNPPALTTIAAARRVFPEAHHVAVFDTAYFADLPPRGFLYPLPYRWYEQYGIRRFGFHGISHAYCASRAAELLDRVGDLGLRLVICHLGNGCSATAVRGGQPIATTMGFTPLEGMMMGTRSGSIDPGVLLYLLRRQVMNVEQLDESLNRHSGLLGVSGISSDFRQIEQAAREQGNERARLAVDMFADRIRATIGSLVVSLGGVDALVFTGGIGQHASDLRSRVCEGLDCLGLELDQEGNQGGSIDTDIAAAKSAARILLVATQEELAIARYIQPLLINLCQPDLKTGRGQRR